MTAHAPAAGHGTPFYANPMVQGAAAATIIEATTHIWENIITPTLVGIAEMIKAKIGLTLWGWALATAGDVLLWGWALALVWYVWKKVWNLIKAWYAKVPGGWAAHH